MKKLSLIFLILTISFNLFAERVSLKDAEKAAKSHYFQSVNSFQKSNVETIQWENINLIPQIAPSKNSVYQFYVFNVNDDDGFVVVSSESTVTPILAYSFEGSYNADNMSPGQKMFLDYYNMCMETAAEGKIDNVSKAHSEWLDLLVFSPGKSYASKSTSDILLGTISWNQNWPYNGMCPADAANSGSFGGHVPVGCVATAMGMVMKYHNWPKQGTGSKYHSSSSNGGFGNMTVNFASQTYNWDNIPDFASKYENEDLAKINYHLGVSVSMRWHRDGSGTQSGNVPVALKNYFKYSSEVKIVNKSSYTDAQWRALLKEQIDAKQPMYYSGYSSESGHAWVCDGYQDNYFHMNWGWGRNGGNGFYALNNLISTATAGGSENNFMYGQDAVINITPNSEFTPACSGIKTIRGNEGVINDGSNSYNYGSNSNCAYVIKPDCGMVISGSFLNFDLASGDYVEIYAGDLTSDDLIASFDAENLPGSQAVVSSKGAMTIRFRTGASSSGIGWDFKYKVETCTNDNYPVFTTKTGSFGDGSGSCDYSSSKHCLWKIESDGATEIKINFTEFDLGSAADWVRIYEDTLLSSNLIREFKLSNLPTSEILVSSEVAYIRFYSSSVSSGGSGWNLDYTTNTELGVLSECAIVSDLTILPNPGSPDSKLYFSLEKSSNARIFVTNSIGQVIYDEIDKFNGGNNEIYLSDIFGGKLKNGMYNISLQVENQTRTVKFITVE
ncbi:C10 family peptidase [Bacteroidales bacterium OttesenSCG-928-I21]|nr:C10 family peptidase [Bacteroidales bacterium OttesenSCG-928-I21]